MIVFWNWGRRCLADSLLGCWVGCSNPVTGHSKFKRGSHSKAELKRMPIEICFHCNSQHLHGAIRAPFSNTPPIIVCIIFYGQQNCQKSTYPCRIRKVSLKICVCTQTGPSSPSPFVLVFPLKIADLVVQKLHFTAFLNLDKDREWGLWVVFGINWKESMCICAISKTFKPLMFHPREMRQSTNHWD